MGNTVDRPAFDVASSSALDAELLRAASFLDDGLKLTSSKRFSQHVALASISIAYSRGVRTISEFAESKTRESSCKHNGALVEKLT